MLSHQIGRLWLGHRCAAVESDGRGSLERTSEQLAVRTPYISLALKFGAASADAAGVIQIPIGSDVLLAGPPAATINPALNEAGFIISGDPSPSI
jgi:hypothetical protein